MSRYNWAKAPEWASHAATDADGSAYWYERKPTLDIAGWVTRGRAEQMPTYIEDYAETMECRPKDTTHGE